MIANLFKKLCCWYLEGGISFFTFSKGENKMINNQLEKLQRDSAELQMFAEKLREEGNYELVKKIIAKRKYLDNRIEQVYGELVS